MKKSKTKNNLQILSPENYIRQKSRNLPIHKCLINKDWEQSKLCNIFLARAHASGNVTVGLFLVDLGCLGIKDTSYKFNVPWEEIIDYINTYEEYGPEFMEVPYELVHNIIYAALEYAEDLGFKPHKDFLSITSFILDEDTDDIPLMPIACGGDNGNPLFVNSDGESPARVKQILAQLDKTVGEGNYHYILEEDDMEDEETEDDEDDEDEEDEKHELLKEISRMSEEEREKQFIELVLKGKEKNHEQLSEDILRIVCLCQSIAYNLVNKTDIDRHLSRFEDVFEHEIVEEEELPNSLFADVQNIDEEMMVDLFYDATEMVASNKNPKKIIAQIREEAGNVAVADFLEIYYLKQKESKKVIRKLEESFLKFPNYFLFHIYRLLATSDGIWSEDIEKMEKLLSDEELPITEFEAQFFFITYFVFLIQNPTTELSQLVAYEEYIQSIESVSENVGLEFFAASSALKMDMVIEHFVQTGKLPALEEQ